jgi:hypothetical protein
MAGPVPGKRQASAEADQQTHQGELAVKYQCRQALQRRAGQRGRCGER